MDREQENFAYLYPRYCRNRNLQNLSQSFCWPVSLSNMAIMKNRIYTLPTVQTIAQNTDTLLFLLGLNTFSLLLTKTTGNNV